MRRDGQHRAFVVGLALALGAIAAIGLGPVYPSETPAATSAPSKNTCDDLEARLAAAAKALEERGVVLRPRLEAINSALQNLEARRETISAAELASNKDKLTAERTAIQNELKFLEATPNAWQAAMDICEGVQGLHKQLEGFRADQALKRVKFVSGDVAAIRSQLAQLRSAKAALDEGEGLGSRRLETLVSRIEKADDRARPALLAERAALQAEAEKVRYRRAALEAEWALLDARLAAAEQALGTRPATQPTTTRAAPTGEAAEAEIRQRMAQQIDAEARDRGLFTRNRLKEIETQLDEASAAGRDTSQLENDREYWQRVEKFEQARLRQAGLQKRAAQEKKAVADLLTRIQEQTADLDELKQSRSRMSAEDKLQQAARLKEQADAAQEQARMLDERAAAEGKGIEPMQQLLPTLDALERALDERWEEAMRSGDYQRLPSHVRRMKRQFDEERQHIGLNITTVEVIAFALTRQATLYRGLADLYRQSADVLVPPVPSFWERHQHVINSAKIVAVVIALTYMVKLGVGLAQYLIAFVSARWGHGRLSVKRIGTLVSFAASIIKLFLWVFGVVWVLTEFGINPAATTGAIGLVGLIMAGMFQHVVVDFVKGLDIIAGRHYNVGDFIEVAGKCGHVVDFNVKHTRIRTFSGQEFNIPNGQCVPSRRFPDGYVNNYVDLTFKSSADAARAKKVIDPVCEDLNQRVEPIRDLPEKVWQFSGPQGRVTLRYRVRVLPGCDWVLTDYFVPAVKQALADKGVELAAEPTFFFINRIDTFRKLFSRELSEEEILRQATEDQQDAGHETDSPPPPLVPAASPCPDEQG